MIMIQNELGVGGGDSLEEEEEGGAHGHHQADADSPEKASGVSPCREQTDIRRSPRHKNKTKIDYAHLNEHGRDDRETKQSAGAKKKKSPATTQTQGPRKKRKVTKSEKGVFVPFKQGGLSSSDFLNGVFTSIIAAFEAKPIETPEVILRLGEKERQQEKDGEKRDGEKRDGEKKHEEKKDGEKKDGEKKDGEKKDGEKRDDKKPKGNNEEGEERKPIENGNICDTEVASSSALEKEKVRLQAQNEKLQQQLDKTREMYEKREQDSKAQIQLLQAELLRHQ